jgi:hypothetical protein
MLASPAAGSHTIQWDTLDGTTSRREANSALLPSRIDSLTIVYQNMVDANSGGDLGEDSAYSIEVMSRVIQRQMQNAGVLGSYCNVLMVAQAVWNRLPANPPAPLEDVIDGSVKTGADLQPVGDWCRQAKQLIIDRSIPIPAVLHRRVSTTKPVVPSQNHWLDTLYAGIQAHIRRVEAERERLAKLTTPPLAVMQTGAAWQHYGRELRREYGKAHTMDTHGNFAFNLELARRRSEDYLNGFTPDQQKKVLLGALYEAYMGQNAADRKDSAAWQIGRVVQLTLDALRDTGVLMRLEDALEGGIVMFESADTTPVAVPITLTGVWYNLLQHREGPQPGMSKVAAAARDSYKALINHMVADGYFVGRTLTVQTRGTRRVLLNENGILIGYVAKQDTHRIPGNTVTVRMATGDGDGNLRLII